MMQEIIELNIDDLNPEKREILCNQGILSEDDIDETVEAILEEAVDQYRNLAEPAAMMKPVSKDDFADIYYGEGLNEDPSPVGDIFPRAYRMVLFAVTLGKNITGRIAKLFDENDFAEASMLDSVASAGADKAADVLESIYRDEIMKEYPGPDSAGVLRYSPGYCGWHISGQKKLFAYLRPEKIGIKLRESYLMDPLKSISGVIIAGPKEIHQFRNDYPCCEKCDDQSCIDRIEALKLR
jgi:hypothetical protein